MIENLFAGEKNNEVIPIQETLAASSEQVQELPKSFLGNFANFVPMIGIMIVFYFFLILPQSKRKKKQDALLASMKRGEEVLTNSGLFGKVIELNEKDESILLEISKGVEIKMLRNSVVKILSRDTKNIT